MIVAVPCNAQGTTPSDEDDPIFPFLEKYTRRPGVANWSYIRLPGQEHDFDGDKTGNPTARVFGGRLYVYVSEDDEFACGPKGDQNYEGDDRYCVKSYSVWSTDDPTLQTNWILDREILSEKDVPWVFKPNGYQGSGRMEASDVVQGDDGLYYLIFAAPNDHNKDAIGVAVSAKPQGPFKPRLLEIPNTAGSDPSVVKLSNGKWVLFTVDKTPFPHERCDYTNSNINWQYIDSDFTIAQKKQPIRNFIANEESYTRAPFAENRSGNLYLYYAVRYGLNGYKIRQAVANSPEDPTEGFSEVGLTIEHFDNWSRPNQASFVTFKGRSYAFYHHYMEIRGWHKRKTVFTPATFKCDGRQNLIRPPVLVDNNETVISSAVQPI